MSGRLAPGPGSSPQMRCLATQVLSETGSGQMPFAGLVTSTSNGAETATVPFRARRREGESGCLQAAPPSLAPGDSQPAVVLGLWMHHSSLCLRLCILLERVPFL